MSPDPPPGKVYLVGGGPGDPGLLTLRGQECLARADLVLYDGLVNPLLLQHTRAATERTSRIAGPVGRRLDQEEINRRLISAACAGQTVVRLKGGDPFIFGRGAEEARALTEARIPFEVVPGITAATAAGVYAGISFTHRESSSAVAFVTGHEDPAKPESALDYAALARFPGTLVFYMGLHRVRTIADALVAAGLDPGTPAAVISRASTPDQRVVTSRVDQIAQQAAAAGLSPPSLIVIGACASQRTGMSWFESRPLFGLRIGITRPEHLSSEVVHATLERGAEPLLLPTMRIEPPEDWSVTDQTLQQLHDFDWLVFTSVNGVEAFLGRLWATGNDLRALGHLKIAAIGPSTARRLEEFSLRADLVPETFRAEALASELRLAAAGVRVLWARADRARDVLARELREAGCQLVELVVYRNVDLTAWPTDSVVRLEAGELDWIGLSSPAIARNFAAMLPDGARQHLGTRTRLVAISPVTAQAAQEVGLPVAVVATEHHWTGILDAIAASRTTSS